MINLSKNRVSELPSNTVEVVSTSACTADVSPIVLNETERIRVKFCPKLINNEKEADKSVCGKLIYEKKRKQDDDFPSEKISRSSIKVGEWMELSLDTSETYELFRGLEQLYKLYSDMGAIPYGTAIYTRVDSRFREFLSIIQNDPNAAHMIGDEKNYELVKTLLDIITQTSSIESLKKSLSELQENNLQQLTTSLNVEKLQRVANLMLDNLDNNSEEFWQTTIFKENQWVLAQIFACPCTIFSGKAYVGGKGIDNIGGNVCDFIYKNHLTQNIALIEIKTPCTELIGNPYRGTYSFSHELSGAVNQVLNYRDKLTKEYYHLCHQSSEYFEALNPKSVVIIGKISSLNTAQVAAFENFRNRLNDVIIITFDEIYERINNLLSVILDS